MRISFILALFFTQLTHAAVPSLLEAPPKEAKINEVIFLKPKKGHHFNLKAPNSCDQGMVLKKEPWEIQCQVTQSGSHKMKVSICDDAKTFCRQEELAVQVGKVGLLTKWLSPKSKVKRQKDRLVHGFIEVRDPKTFAKIQQQAKTSGKLLLIDFFAIWCPPCNYLDEFVFNKSEFTQASKSFVKVRVDADDPVSSKWKSHFKVGSYPTVLVADSQLREIDRFEGSLGVKEVSRFLAASLENQKVPLESLAKKFQAKMKLNLAESIRLAKWSSQQRNYESVVSLLKDQNRNQEGEQLFLQAKIQMAKLKGEPKQAARLYRKLLKKYPLHVEASIWALSLMDLEEKSEDAVKMGLKSIHHWRGKSEAEELGMTQADLWQIEGYFYEGLKEDEKAKKAFVRCAIEHKKTINKAKSGKMRQPRMEMAYCLHKAGLNKEAAHTYEALIKDFGNEFTFLHNYAGALYKIKEFKKAHIYSTKAVKYSYGDNYLRAVHLKAKIESAMNKKAMALRTVNQALKNYQIPSSPHVRGHRYWSRLRNLKSELGSF